MTALRHLTDEDLKSLGIPMVRRFSLFHVVFSVSCPHSAFSKNVSRRWNLLLRYLCCIFEDDVYVT